jgi:hypothetical protein
MTTVAIACTTVVYALLFSGQSDREGTGGKIGVARIECFNTQRRKHCEEENSGKRPAFHEINSLSLKYIRRTRAAGSGALISFAVLAEANIPRWLLA